MRACLDKRTGCGGRNGADASQFAGWPFGSATCSSLLVATPSSPALAIETARIRQGWNCVDLVQLLCYNLPLASPQVFWLTAAQHQRPDVPSRKQKKAKEQQVTAFISGLANRGRGKDDATTFGGYCKPSSDTVGNRYR